MESPFTGGTVRLEKKFTSLEYRKEQFGIMYHYYVCNDTGEHFTDDSIDTLNITQVHNQYRAKYDIPFVEEIKEMRHSYGLSAAKMSKVFGFGANLYRLYEDGEMPSVANGRLMKLAEDPDEFRRLVYMNRHALEEDEYGKVQKKLHLFLDHWNRGKDYYERKLIGCTTPNIYNGYRKPRLKKIAAMVNFFAHQNQPFLTALNKLMFYADFAHYKKHGYGISGACYMAYGRGPVPDNYGAIYNEIVNQGYAEVIEVDFEDYVGEKFRATQLKFNKAEELFTETEWNVLKKVSETFKGLNTRQIVDISHREKGWQDNVNDQNHINFLYGFEIKHI